MGKQPIHDRSTKHTSIAYSEELDMDHKLLYKKGQSVSRRRASMCVYLPSPAHIRAKADTPIGDCRQKQTVVAINTMT